MNKYVIYIQENYLLIGAVYYEWSIRKGKGLLGIRNNGYRIHFKPYSELSDFLKGMIDRNPNNVVINFEDATNMSVKLPESPEICYQKIGKRLDEFIVKRGIVL
ncbi:hypothetical protein [Limnoraphis robusta]|uniref:hypothetical protein n=1 Tax=Limnoraphis robusta TaxID=1118279 RepID=UPI002B1EB250|nr:hypothetical protein [Limnoraphis robusta]MEA5498035.1 hypothetical protein [Limnoraphis robusta BA-68 BA1]